MRWAALFGFVLIQDIAEKENAFLLPVKILAAETASSDKIGGAGAIYLFHCPLMAEGFEPATNSFGVDIGNVPTYCMLAF